MKFEHNWASALGRTESDMRNNLKTVGLGISVEVIEICLS